MKKYRPDEALLFVTGASTLALELLASRIMTPYFGVSLYIWAGILSITLIFLAYGYRLGGRVTGRLEKDSLQFLFLAAPVSAALSIVVATALYPVVFPWLSYGNLIVASFLGGVILLALPLIMLSAMNPLLIALERDSSTGADAGAGRVFFISTIGSVAGVMLTAFVLIPNLTNFRALLWISLGLCLVSGGVSLRNRDVSMHQKRRLLSGCVIVALMCGAILWGQRSYFKLLAEMVETDKACTVLAEYTSVFGNIKVVEVQEIKENSKPMLLLLQDGINQNYATPEGEPQDHTNVMIRLAQGYGAAPHDSLVLGLGAGVMPQYLQRQGQKVSAVEINPDSLKAATEFFHFNPNKVACHLQDARPFVRRHPNSYDLVVVDLFQGDTTPDYLLTLEFFRELRACLRPRGVAIMNFYFDPVDETPNAAICATITEVFPHVLEFRSPSSANLIRNAYMVAANSPLAPEAALKIADAESNLLAKDDYQTLKAARQINRHMFKNATPLSDDHNIFSVLSARSQLRYRSQFNRLPPNLLVN